MVEINRDFIEAPHIMIVEGRYYEDIADELYAGATAALDEAGATYERYTVPGALEIPAAINVAIRSLDYYGLRKRFDGYIALGCVIRGETSHYDVVCRESCRALQDLMLEYSLAIGNGILTVEDKKQAMARAKTSKKNKGGEAATACLEMLLLKQHFGIFPRE